MKINLGAVVILTRRAAQFSAYLMLGMNTLNLVGLKLRGWLWVAFGVVLVAYILLDVLVIYPQEQDYSVRRNETLLKGLGLKER